jgi:ADP-ribosylglycohydrolase
LVSITIPSGITHVRKRAFAGCKALTSMISKAVTPPTLGKDVFDEVDKSIPVFVSKKSLEKYKTAEGWREFTNIQPI